MTVRQMHIRRPLREAVYYRNLSTAQVSSALARTDAKEREQKLADAEATCENATALDRTEALGCWKNIGILLTTKMTCETRLLLCRKRHN
jgi:hypothetical protein